MRTFACFTRNMFVPVISSLILGLSCNFFFSFWFSHFFLLVFFSFAASVSFRIASIRRKVLNGKWTIVKRVNIFRRHHRQVTKLLYACDLTSLKLLQIRAFLLAHKTFTLVDFRHRYSNFHRFVAIFTVCSLKWRRIEDKVEKRNIFTISI